MKGDKNAEKTDAQNRQDNKPFRLHSCWLLPKRAQLRAEKFLFFYMKYYRIVVLNRIKWTSNSNYDSLLRFVCANRWWIAALDSLFPGCKSFVMFVITSWLACDVFAAYRYGGVSASALIHEILLREEKTDYTHLDGVLFNADLSAKFIGPIRLPATLM